MTRVVVAGAGSIGSLLAAHLARVADVTVLTRREEHAAVLREQGLRVSGRSDFTAQLGATVDSAALPEDAELAILACKGTDLEPLAARLADEAKGGQVLITQRLYAEVEDQVEAVRAGEYELKGFGRPVPALDVVAVREAELTEA